MLKFFKILIPLLLLLSSCSSEIEKPFDSLYKHVTFLNHKSDSLSIKDIVKLHEKGAFNVPMKNKVVYYLKNKEATWLHFKLNNTPKKMRFSIWGIYIDYSKVYLFSDNTIKPLNTISLSEKNGYNSEYRFPSWKLGQIEKQTDVFVKVKDNKRATSLKLLLQDDDEFLTFVRNDYFKLGIILVFLIIMAIIILSLFIAKKQYSLIWYGLYILLFTGELLITNGIDSQFNFFTSPIINNVKKMLFQTSGAVFAGLFFINFYPYTKETLIAKKTFKLITAFYIISVLIISSFILVNDVYLPKIYLWFPGRIIILIVIGLHFFLIKKRVLPSYLGIAFIIPILAYFLFISLNIKQDWTHTTYFLLENSLQLAFMLEMIFIFFYIIKQLVKSEFLAINLQNENLTLRNSFQNSILKSQENERNKLLSNVHDSFGGYLEALKLRLMNKNENSPEKVKEILDSFDKEYRYLLNSLYSPKINSENLIENLIEFFDKINRLTDSPIRHEFSLEESELPPEKCLHIYRIISELITNAIKYAKASEINVKISESSNLNIIIQVSDNGIGFDINKMNNSSFGLNSIKERVNLLNGLININSQKNLGTSIKITIPKNNE